MQRSARVLTVDVFVVATLSSLAACARLVTPSDASRPPRDARAIDAADIATPGTDVTAARDSRPAADASDAFDAGDTSDAPDPCLRPPRDAAPDGLCVTVDHGYLNFGRGAEDIPRPWWSSCTNDSECATGYCIDGRCDAHCTTDRECPSAPNWQCGEGTCWCRPSIVELCDGNDNNCNGRVDECARCSRQRICVAGGCVCPPERTCGDECVDFRSNGAHCGACGVRCGPRRLCAEARCVPLEIEQVVSVAGTNCARISDGTVRCWGLGYLGNGVPVGGFTPSTTGDEVTSPEPVASLTGVRRLLASGRHLCAWRDDGSIACWGDDFAHGAIEFGIEPSDVCKMSGGLPNPWAVGCSLTPNTSCALRDVASLVDIGVVQCVVTNGGDSHCRMLANVSDASWDATDVAQLAAIDRTVCALHGSGVIECVDVPRFASDGTPPVRVGDLVDTRRLALSLSTGCALRTGGVVSCWGRFLTGGDLAGSPASPYDSAVPIALAGVDRVVDLVATPYTTCALRDDGRVICWGTTPYAPLSSIPPTIMREMPAADAIWGGAVLCIRARDDGSVWCTRVDGAFARVAF